MIINDNPCKTLEGAENKDGEEETQIFQNYAMSQ